MKSTYIVVVEQDGEIIGAMTVCDNYDWGDEISIGADEVGSVAACYDRSRWARKDDATAKQEAVAMTRSAKQAAESLEDLEAEAAVTRGGQAW